MSQRKIRADNLNPNAISLLSAYQQFCKRSMDYKRPYQNIEIFPEPRTGIFSQGVSQRQRLVLLVSLIALLQLLLHLGAIGQYGFHQDELLYISLSKRLALGYSETPPFIALIGKLSSMLLGESLIAYRLIPAICAGAIVHLTGMLCIRLGGGFFATAIACLSVALSSAFLATGALFIPQVFDELFWLLAAYLLVCWWQRPRDIYLYLLGAVIGIGLLVKYTLIIYLLGLLLGFLIYPRSRSVFKRPALYNGALIALLIFLPHLYWQFQNGFPALHHYRELGHTQLVYLTRTDFLIQQLVVNGTGILVWLPGLYYCLTSPKLRHYRFLGIAFIFVMVVLLLLNGKAYYGFGAFPAVFALGAVVLESAIGKRTVFRSGLISLLIIPNLLLAVIVLPYLSIEKAAKVFQWTYANLDLHFPLKWEDQKIHNVNQNYADMIGWDELAHKASQLYQSFPSTQQRDVLIFADNYGEAGAMDYYRSSYPLPPVVSFSSSFALWAPQKINQNTIIYISARPLPQMLSEGTRKYGEIQNPYSRVKGMSIYLLGNNDRFSIWYSRHKSKSRPNRNYYADRQAAAKSSQKPASKLE
ncbi:glycosyltransferase family 39 protein [Pedobacter polaris]|uniref:Glycosyltransferase family 39 protein n=1 Tax=Pedobacter polaris TaxID=2571273 RepID=A0A4U1CTV4_9SPHI|nr:glycosyltransferase family 39 protein [Pedobacter polaris]TKC10540.1 glycosyltransferase family 39 protein [Pedobacter polaris]